MRQRVEGVSLGWRQARVTADGARAQARARREVVRREEEGLRLAQELSEDRLLVALETLELAKAKQAQKQRTLERKTPRHGARRTSGYRTELRAEVRCCGGTRRASGRCDACATHVRGRCDVCATLPGTRCWASVLSVLFQLTPLLYPRPQLY